MPNSGFLLFVLCIINYILYANKINFQIIVTKINMSLYSKIKISTIFYKKYLLKKKKIPAIIPYDMNRFNSPFITLHTRVELKDDSRDKILQKYE